MTGTCILCGTLLTAEPDPILDAQRDERTMGKLGALMKQHGRSWPPNPWRDRFTAQLARAKRK
jgi:hypothetical protein